MDGGRRGGVARGTALAALSAVLTAVGHAAGGGAIPDLAVLLVLVPMLAAVFVSVAHACRSALGTVAVLGAGQVVLHQLLVLLHSHAGSPAVLDASSMLTMHAAVTLVTAVALRHADQAVVALVAALAGVLPRRLTPLPASRPLRLRAVPELDVPARLALAFTTTAPRRGPPVGC